MQHLYGAATRGQRIAGGMLVVNAVLVFVQADLVPAGSKLAPFMGPVSVVSGFFDIVIGVLLVLKYGRLAVWALVRVVLGLVLFTLIHVSSGDMLSAGIQVGVSLALLLLLIGRAGALRLALGGLLFGVYMLIAGAGLSMLATGYNPIGGAMASLKGELDGPAVGELQGIASPYHVQVPDTGWYQRTRANALRDNPLADRWLVEPRRDVHLLVIDEQLPVAAPVDLLADTTIANSRAAAADYTLVSREPLPAYPEDGRLIHNQYSVEGLAFESWVGVVTANARSYQIIALAQRSSFPAASSELRAMVESFRLPEGPPPLPTGVVPGPAGRVLGIVANYAITAPGERWHLRTAEAAHADNPSADRWLTRPDRDAHVLVIAEETVNEAPLAEIMTTLQDLLRASNSATVFGPVEPAPHGGLGMHTTMPTAEMTLEFEYRVHRVGNRTFRVIAFVRQEFYPSVADELRQVVDGFEPPSL